MDADEHYVLQDGRYVYKHAVTDMLTSTQDVMRRNGLTVDDVDYLIPHQANLRIIEAVADRAGFPMDKVLVNIQHTGNTSAASLPRRIQRPPAQRLETDADGIRGRLHMGRHVHSVGHITALPKNIFTKR